MSGMAQLMKEDGSSLMDHATYKKCFNSAFFYTMANDGLNNKKADYTKCALYKHYGLDPDWTEFNEARISKFLNHINIIYYESKDMYVCMVY